MNYYITNKSDHPLAVEIQTLRKIVAKVFPHSAVETAPISELYAAAWELTIDRSNELMILRDNSAILLTGDIELLSNLASEIARTLNPDDQPIMTDEGYSGVIELSPTTTMQEIVATFPR